MTMSLSQEIPSNKTSSSFDRSTNSPQRKKQKTHASRPPFTPTTTKTMRTLTTAWPVEARCEEEQQSIARIFQGHKRMEQRQVMERRAVQTHSYDHLTPPHCAHTMKHLDPSLGEKRLCEDDNCCVQVDKISLVGRSSSLEGLELLETMSFDEQDYQGDDEDDASLSYSLVSEGQSSTSLQY